MADIAVLLFISVSVGALAMSASIFWKTWWLTRFVLGIIGAMSIGMLLLILDFLAHPFG